MDEVNKKVGESSDSGTAEDKAKCERFINKCKSNVIFFSVLTFSLTVTTTTHGFVPNINHNHFVIVCVAVDRIIANGFKEDEVNEINDADCTKALPENEDIIKKKLVEINKKYSENLRNIFDVEAQISEMTSGNANCGDNDLYLISGQEIWDL